MGSACVVQPGQLRDLQRSTFRRVPLYGDGYDKRHCSQLATLERPSDCGFPNIERTLDRAGLQPKLLEMDDEGILSLDRQIRNRGLLPIVEPLVQRVAIATGAGQMLCVVVVVTAENIGKGCLCADLLPHGAGLQPPLLEEALGFVKLVRAKASALELAGGTVETCPVEGGTIVALPEEPFVELKFLPGVPGHGSFPCVSVSA